MYMYHLYLVCMRRPYRSSCIRLFKKAGALKINEVSRKIRRVCNDTSDSLVVEDKLDVSIHHNLLVFKDKLDVSVCHRY